MHPLSPLLKENLELISNVAKVQCRVEECLSKFTCEAGGPGFSEGKINQILNPYSTGVHCIGVLFHAFYFNFGRAQEYGLLSRGLRYTIIMAIISGFHYSKGFSYPNPRTI